MTTKIQQNSQFSKFLEDFFVKKYTDKRHSLAQLLYNNKYEKTLNNTEIWAKSSWQIDTRKNALSKTAQRDDNNPMIYAESYGYCASIVRLLCVNSA